MQNNQSSHFSMKKLNYLDLFSGIGGFSLGFEQAGYNFDKHYYSEINKYAIQVYQKHFPTAVGLGTITGIKPEELGKIDIITFGFPCQDLSSAGNRAGYSGKRSVLFFEAIRLIQELKPSVFIFENVEGLLTHGEGRTFETTLRTIADLGLYECEWQLLNSRWFLPQNRPRIYFIGYLEKKSIQKVFPFTQEDIKNRWKKSAKRVVSDCLTCSSAGGATAGGSMIRKTKNGLRVLTEVECERLQGFPDNWTKGITKRQRYKACGNAVSVPITRYIAQKLKESVIW